MRAILLATGLLAQLAGASADCGVQASAFVPATPLHGRGDSSIGTGILVDRSRRARPDVPQVTPRAVVGRAFLPSAPAPWAAARQLRARECRPSLGLVFLGMASAADAVRSDEQDRVFRTVGTSQGLGDAEAPEDAIKIVSYNVLGPKQALTDKHAYSNFKWRKWPYRKERIFEELRAYDADVICLQEVTPDTFLNDFAPFMKEIGLEKGIYTPKRLPDGEKSRGPFRRPSKGRRLPPELFGTGTHMCLGTATFIKSSKFNLLGSERVLLRSKLPMLIERATNANTTEPVAGEDAAEAPVAEEEPVIIRSPPPKKGKGGRGKGTKRQRQLQKKAAAAGANTNSRRARRRLRGMARGRPISALLSLGLGKDVKTKADTACLTYLELRASGAGEPEGAAAAPQSKRLLVANTHLFWDPRRPDVKAVQAALLGACITSFIDERIVREDKEEGGGRAQAQAAAGGHTPAGFPSVVICGDFNSVPHVQHEFLNARAAAFASAAEVAEDGGAAGGMSEREGGGRASQAAIPVCEEESGEGDAADTSTEGEEEEGWDDEEEDDPGIEEDKEEEEAEAYALLTTMSDGSAGRGDDAESATPGATGAAAKSPSAVWALMAEGCAPAAHPEHPASFGSSVNLPDLLTGLPPLKNAYEAHGQRVPPLTTKTSTFSGCIDHIWCSDNLEVEAVLDMPYRPGEHDSFRPIPDARWGSDHLAIGVRIRL